MFVQPVSYFCLEDCHQEGSRTSFVRLPLVQLLCKRLQAGDALKLKNCCLTTLALSVVLVMSLASSPLIASPIFIPASVQQKPMVHLSEAQARSFSDALDALSEQGHVAIVAEGVPLVPRLAKKDAPDLTTAVPLSQAVAEVAARYDYDVQKQDDIFVLTKRYTNLKELPCVTLEECRGAFSDVVTLLDRFSPQFDEGSEDNSQRGAAVAFFASLSPAELYRAQTKSLHYGELTPDQKEIVSRLLLYGIVPIPINLSQDSINVLNYAPKSALTGKDGDYKALLIQVPVPADRAQLYYRSLYSSGKAIYLDQPQPTLILPKPQATTLPHAPDPKTLGDVVGLLAHKGPPPAVDVALKDKPVSVAGLANASTQNILDALTLLYGLRISVSDAGGPLLTRQILTTDDNLQDLTENIWETVPVSIRRAMHQEYTAPLQGVPNKPADAVQDFQQRIEPKPSLVALREEAEHQVLVGVQPQFRSKGLSVRIPVKTLDKATSRALAVALSGGVLGSLLESFTGQTHQTVMDCLDDMDDVVISTVPAQAAEVHGQLVPSVYFEGTNPYTKQQISLGGVQFMGTR